jgi:UDP-N-acetylmuramyl pentapeptide phosphotransferase/UDP-N-acetylglucosamine-1-phosphate transferase
VNAFYSLSAHYGVNLVNFMDGLDWMTVVEVVPITAALAAIGLLGYIPWQDTVINLSLCGATIGFAFFNRPVAKLFLGDVGSLPIGLLLGWPLLLLAGSSGRIAAILLPLYYLADSTVTLQTRSPAKPFAPTATRGRSTISSFLLFRPSRIYVDTIPMLAEHGRSPF